MPKRQRLTAWKSELAEINAKARQEGMSYGKYVGLMYCEERDEMESEEAIDSVIGWHYEVIPTDELSKCEPFCYSMPLTDTYIKLNEMEVVGNVFDNPELLEEENVHGTD